MSNVETLVILPVLSEREEKYKKVSCFSDGIARITKEWKEEILNAKLMGDYSEVIDNTSSPANCVFIHLCIGTDCIGTVSILTNTIYSEWIVNPKKIIEVQ